MTNHDLLRKRWLSFIRDKWYCKNTYDRNYKDVGNFSAVYFFVAFNWRTNESDIVYIGSTSNLFLRYKSHGAHNKIASLKDNYSVFYFKPMEKGYYDYERKLITKLKPLFNKQFVNRDKNDK